MPVFEPPTVKYPHQKILWLLRDRGIQASRYLDLGCGSGDFTLEVADTVGARTVCAIDENESSLGTTPQERIDFSKVNLNHEKLPYPSDYFDLVSIVEVVEHLINTNNALLEAFRVTKKDGYFIVSTPNLANWRNRLLLLVGRYPHMLSLPHEDGHIRLYTAQALSARLEHTGFRIVDRAGTPTRFECAPAGIYYGILGRIDGFLSRKASLATGVVVLARKSTTSPISPG